MKRISVFLSLNMIFLLSSGQGFHFGLEMGMGSYAMTGLKDINQNVAYEIPFEGGIVSNFPSYYYYEPSVTFSWKRFGAGLIYSFQSTGSRVSAADNTGEYRFDMKIKSNSPGIILTYNIMHQCNWQIALYYSAKMSYSSLWAKEYLIANEIVFLQDSATFKASNIVMEPGARFSYTRSLFSIGCDLGYAFSAGSQNFESASDRDYSFYYPASIEKTRPEWNGFRFGAFLNIRIFRFRNQESPCKNQE